MLVVLLMTIVGGVTGQVILQSMKVYSRAVPAMTAGYQLRTALDRMTREIRNLKDTDSITTMNSTTLEFTDAADASIAYVASGGELRRNGDLLAEGVAGCTFTYRQADSSAASTSSEVRLIEIDLTVESGGQQRRARTAVFPRVAGHSAEVPGS